MYVLKYKIPLPSYRHVDKHFYEIVVCNNVFKSNKIEYIAW